jgi:hypothetical protein
VRTIGHLLLHRATRQLPYPTLAPQRVVW